MPHFALTAVGADRPGIVAGVTGSLVELGCNLEDTSMTILRGFFAMVMVVAAPPGVDAADLQAAAGPAAEELGLGLWVRSVDEPAGEAMPGDSWVVSVHGADRPGIVHRVTRVLADAGVNVADLSTHMFDASEGGAAPAGYVMVLDVVVPDACDVDRLRADLAAAAADLGVDAAMRPADPDLF